MYWKWQLWIKRTRTHVGVTSGSARSIKYHQREQSAKLFLLPIVRCFKSNLEGGSDPKQTRDQRAKLNYIISGLLLLLQFNALKPPSAASSGLTRFDSLHIPKSKAKWASTAEWTWTLFLYASLIAHWLGLWRAAFTKTFFSFRHSWNTIVSICTINILCRIHCRSNLTPLQLKSFAMDCWVQNAEYAPDLANSSKW